MDPKIDMSELAMKMLRWQAAQLFADDLHAEIVDTVLQIKRTYTVGRVRASYSGGRKSYDYEMAAILCPAANQGVISEFTIMPEPYIDWRKVCTKAEIDKADIPFTQSEPSVTVKLLAE